MASLPLVMLLATSEGALKVCAERGVTHTYRGTVDALAASRHEPFDTFILAGNNLGLLGGVDAGRHFLASLTKLSSPRAHVLGEVTDPYRTTDPAHLAYHEENRRLGRLAGQIRLRIRHRLLVTDWFDYLFCTPEELEALVAPTPWRLEAVHPRMAADGPSGTWVAVLAQPASTRRSLDRGPA